MITMSPILIYVEGRNGCNRDPSWFCYVFPYTDPHPLSQECGDEVLVPIIIYARLLASREDFIWIKRGAPHDFLQIEPSHSGEVI